MITTTYGRLAPPPVGLDAPSTVHSEKRDLRLYVMAACNPNRWVVLAATPALLLAAAIVFLASPARAQILPWEVAVAEVEAGRLRGLVERLDKQNLLYQLRLDEIRKADLVETSGRIDRVIASLRRGNPSYSVPPAWTPEIRLQLEKLDDAWGPLRRIAIATSYDTFRFSREFVPRANRQGDPLLLRYFENLSQELLRESETLLEIYHQECVKTGLEVCDTAHNSGYPAMLIERAAKEAVNIIADIDGAKSRKRLQATVDAYLVFRDSTRESAFFAEALDPERGVNARAAGELLRSLRADWDEMEAQFTILAAGDVENFDLPQMLRIHTRLADKIDRITAAFVRYAGNMYGA